MKTSISITFVLAVLFIGCNNTEVDDIIEEPKNEEKEPVALKELTDGFCLVVRDTVILNHNDFEYYDYSAHLIYMKDHMSFTDDIQGNGGEFKVYANEEEIYSGVTHPGFSSSFPLKPVIINTWPPLHADYLIPLEYFQLTDYLGNILPDPRNDDRIADALKKYGQFHAGLSCEIDTVQYFSSDSVIVKLLLTNNDTFNFYYLDPDKMGISQFHYITNGLTLRDTVNSKTYTHKVETKSPDSGETWKDWVSKINSGESKIITIFYDSFENVPNGQYKATFRLSGLNNTEKEDLFFDDGQLWLGHLNSEKEILVD